MGADKIKQERTSHAISNNNTPRVPWFLVVLVASWYGASTMNSVATQEFVGLNGLGKGFERDMNTMMVVTIAQLLAGAAMGSVFLVLMGETPRIETKLSLWHSVPALHALGSLFTNVGFTYGSASVVQVIKLLEPVETLMVGKLLGSATVVSGPILASLAMLIGGTVGTLSGWQKPPAAMAVIFASLSGISLATRNAAKKRFQEKGKASGFVNGVKEFVNLSVWGALSLLVPAVAHSIVFRGSLLLVDMATLASLVESPKMILFHGIYNLSSLAVLGYVSALTHSVLNVGKRMTNIVVATIFFSEKLAMERVGVGLTVSSVGMLWYASISKGGMETPSCLRQWTVRKTRVLILAGLFLFVSRSFFQSLENPGLPRETSGMDTNGLRRNTPEYGLNETAPISPVNREVLVVPKDQGSIATEELEDESKKTETPSESTTTEEFTASLRTSPREQEQDPGLPENAAGRTDHVQGEPEQKENTTVSLIAPVSTENQTKTPSTNNCVATFKTEMYSCHYLAYGSNFGDALGPLILDRIVDRHFAPCKAVTQKIDIAPGKGNEHRKSDQKCIFIVGSVWHYLQPHDAVWGIGAKAPNTQVPDDVDVYAVRGPRTNGIFQAKANTSIGLPQGDPGFLLPRLFPEIFETEPDEKKDYCLVYHAKDTRTVRNQVKHDKEKRPDRQSIFVIDPRLPWKDVVQTIHSCKYVAGSSLHGIIIADSLGIPTLWYQVPRGGSSSEGSFKYTDYFGSIKRNVTKPVTNWDLLIDSSRYSTPIPLVERETIWNGMLDSFPYQLFKNDTDSSALLDNGKLIEEDKSPLITNGTSVVAVNAEPVSSPISAAGYDLPNEAENNCVATFKREMYSCHYLAYGSNFGDALGPLVLDRIVDRHFAPCKAVTRKIDIAPGKGNENRKSDQNCIFIVGSVWHYLQPNDAVWGIGAKAPNTQVPDDVDVYAVRGPRTNGIFQAKANTSIGLPQGDPGFLLPHLFPELFETEPDEKKDYCLVYHAKDTRTVRNQVKHDKEKRPDRQSIFVIDPRLPWKDVVQTIHSCKYVAGSSLHGIIIADSLGIPTLWYQVPRGGSSSEGSFKYTDYFGSIKRNVTKPVTNWELLIDSTRYSTPIPLAERETIWNGMLDSFPYQLFKNDTDSSALPDDGELIEEDKSPLITNGTSVVAVNARPVSSQNSSAGYDLPIEVENNCTATFKKDMYSCHYLAYGSNFGDALGPLILDRIVDRHFTPCKAVTRKIDIAPGKGHENRKSDQNCIFIVGSVWHYLQPNDAVWGIGAKTGNTKVPDDVDVYAVRGPRTNGIFQAKANTSTALPQGDPGFLLPRLFPELFESESENKREFCLVYHAKDTRTVKGHVQEDKKANATSPTIHIIDPRLPWKQVVQTIHSCKYVAGSSLHGIIIADSLGIPTLWYQVHRGGSASEGSFKYTDYFGSIKRNVTKPVRSWNSLTNTSLYSLPIPLEEREAMWDDMLKSFPYDLFERN